MSKRAREVHTPRGKYPIDDYSQRYLAFLLPDIDQTLGTLQVLVHIVTVNRSKNFRGSNETAIKFINTKIFYANIF